MNPIDSLFVPDLVPSMKHPTVLKKFDELKCGESFLLINDHDPLPLYYEMKVEKGEIFNWKNIENGPEVWKVEITKTTGKTAPADSIKEEQSIYDGEVAVLNVCLLEPSLKHSTIFKKFDALNPGESFQILNDHDPKPLYYQMLGERGNFLKWEYLEKGPLLWRVQITKNNGEVETLGEIATKDLRKAGIFIKYGLDFCCGGKKTVQQACAEKGIDATLVESELRRTELSTESRPLNYSDWSPDFLADYIVNTHHAYVRKTLPELSYYAAKVSGVHGEHHPELIAIYHIVESIALELNDHMHKEEQVLFVFIKQLVKSKNSGNTLHTAVLDTIEDPIQMMEHEHKTVGDFLAKIRRLSKDYSIPEDACASYRLFFKMMEEFEADLFIHIHLENNILFPKALQMEREIR